MLSEFLKNAEPLRICIRSYKHQNIDIICYSPEYYKKHWEVFKGKKYNQKLKDEEFYDKLDLYLFTQKVSELLIIVYLLDKKQIYPNMFQLNKFLGRNISHFSATFKEVKKLCALDILKLEPGTKRRERIVLLNKAVVKIYGDDEFRQMLLNEWNKGAKKYTKIRRESLIKEREEMEKKIERMKKGRRIKDDKEILVEN